MLKTCLLIVGSVMASIEVSLAAGFVETFDTNPAQNGWQSFGNSNLFVWNSSEKYLNVTWDSSNSNSYFYKPLGTMLTRKHRFGFSFDLYLTNIAAGTTPDKPYAFEFAIGLINFTNATSSNFIRGTGSNSPNIVEFDYFPDAGFGATISPTIISASNEWASSFNFPLELNPNVLFRVNIDFDPDIGKLSTTITSNGDPFASIDDVVLETDFSDFFVDTLAICSYTDAGQDPMWSGSITAKGFVDNFSFYYTPPVTPKLAINKRTDNQWEITFESQSSWKYSLERSDDLINWSVVIPSTPGNDGTMTFYRQVDESEHTYFRVKAEKP